MVEAVQIGLGAKPWVERAREKLMIVKIDEETGEEFAILRSPVRPKKLAELLGISVPKAVSLLDQLVDYEKHSLRGSCTEYRLVG